MSSTPPPASREGILLANSGENYHRWTLVSRLYLDAMGNGAYFEIELDKLNKWGEDRWNSLRLTLKDMDDRIKESKKNARLAPNLPEKLQLEEERRQLEGKRDEAWREYDHAAREIEKRTSAKPLFLRKHAQFWRIFS